MKLGYLLFIGLISVIARLVWILISAKCYDYQLNLHQESTSRKLGMG